MRIQDIFICNCSSSVACDGKHFSFTLAFSDLFAECKCAITSKEGGGGRQGDFRDP